MSDYDFILDSLNFSYSGVSTYETCPYSFYLTYIEAAERGNNFFGEFGTFCHDLLEKYFKGELESFEFGKYYEENYFKTVVSPPPPFIKDAVQNYYDKGFEFFSNFDFDKSDYEILLAEEYVKTEFENINITVKPDLILKDKDGKVILVDFKTANAYKNGKLDKSKMKGYLRQFYLYTYFLNKVKNIKIDEIHVWFITVGKTEIIKCDDDEMNSIVKWFVDSVRSIYKDGEFKANTSNPFFCNFLCSVSNSCQYKPSI